MRFLAEFEWNPFREMSNADVAGIGVCLVGVAVIVLMEYFDIRGDFSGRNWETDDGE